MNNGIRKQGQQLLAGFPVKSPLNCRPIVRPFRLVKGDQPFSFFFSLVDFSWIIKVDRQQHLAWMSYSIEAAVLSGPLWNARFRFYFPQFAETWLNILGSFLGVAVTRRLTGPSRLTPRMARFSNKTMLDTIRSWFIHYITLLGCCSEMLPASLLKETIWPWKKK